MQNIGVATSDLSAQADDKTFEKSLLYQEFLAERSEILRHKWIESEKVGHDIGFEKALLDWTVQHRGSWRSLRQKENPSNLKMTVITGPVRL